MVAAKDPKIVSGDDIPVRDDKGETVKSSDMPDRDPRNTRDVSMTDDQYAAYEKWARDQENSGPDKVTEEREPKRRTDVTALEEDLSRLFATHGWSWPEPLDDVETDDSNR